MRRSGSRRKSHAPTGYEQPSQRSRSLFIPILVGSMVLLIVVGGILATNTRRSESASVPGGIWMPGNTAQPLPTRLLPYPGAPRLSLQEAWQALQQGTAILVDVRSRAAFDKMHAAGAISIPEDEVWARLAELPPDKAWILYCN